MVTNIIVCIAAIVLFFRGILLWERTKIICMLYVKIMKDYTLKTYGRVVDMEVESRVCNQNKMHTVKLNCPIVEYKLGEEEEVNRQLATYDLLVEVNDVYVLYPQKTLHIGDKVIIRCKSNDSKKIVACCSMPFIRLFFNLFIPGIFYLVSSVLGICYLFAK